jgi:hypothetical protein
MKKLKIVMSLLCVVAIIVSSQCFYVAYAAEKDECAYVYTINLKVSNPCNSKDMDKDAVNEFYFSYYYCGQNGFKDESNDKFEMSWSGSSNKNSEFLNKYFIRPNDDSYNTSFDVTLAGKLNRIYIKLNMDGGERLSFTVESVYCNGKRINSNTDNVSSAYNDSTANIYCSMEKSVIDETNSPYFKTHDDIDFTEKELNNIVNNISSQNEYVGQFKDQYNSVIEMSALKNCIGTSDGDINQGYSHHDEESMYKYTLYFNVENPINLTDADYDEVEVFYIEFTYVDQNGYGDKKTYTLDMAYSKDLKRNQNQEFLSCFEKYNDDEYNTSFSVWVPGIVTDVKCKLNMSGEKLSANLEKIAIDSVAINKEIDYISSTYYDSTAKIECSAPASKIVTSDGKLPEKYTTDLKDQYGAVISESVYNKAKEDANRYLYHN